MLEGVECVCTSSAKRELCRASVSWITEEDRLLLMLPTFRPWPAWPAWP